MSKVFKLILPILILTNSFHLFGAAWNADFLIIRNDTLRLSSNPLTQSKQSALNIELYFAKKPLECTLSYWRLEDNRLYLVEIVDSDDKNNTADLSMIFGNDYKNGRVFANWLTGELLYPKGKIIDFPGISTSEKEIVLAFEKGIFIEKYEYDNSKSYKSFFTQNPDTLFSFIYNNINWNTLPNIDDGKKLVALRIMTGGEKSKFQISILKGIDSLYNNEALRVAKLIPEWDVLYVHGQPKPISWFLPINFTNEMKLKYTTKIK